MPISPHPGTERILRVPIPDDVWDDLYELAQQARREPKDYVSVLTERHVRRNKPKSTAEKVA